MIIVLHKKVRNQRIQNAYNDGIISIVKKTNKVDDFNTPIPGKHEIKVLGTYFFRLKGIHSQDKFEFGNKGIELERKVLIPLNLHIHSGMTAVLNENNGDLFDIIKVFPDFTNNELEILLAKEGGYDSNTQTRNQ